MQADGAVPSWLRTDVEFWVCCWGFEMQIGWGATAAVPLLDMTDADDERLERLVCGAIGKAVGFLDTGRWGAAPTPPATATVSEWILS